MDAPKAGVYLKAGTGKACAWQTRAKDCPTRLMKVLLRESEGKEGALAPTGSAEESKRKADNDNEGALTGTKGPGRPAPGTATRSPAPLGARTSRFSNRTRTSATSRPQALFQVKKVRALRIRPRLGGQAGSWERPSIAGRTPPDNPALMSSRTQALYPNEVKDAGLLPK